MVSLRDARIVNREKKEQQRLQEAAQENPRIKSIKLSGARLAVRIARQAKSSSSVEEIGKFSIAQSTISIAMVIVEDDFQRASRLIEMARSIANINKKVEPTT